MLVTLGIIGVVSAMTVPTLMQNYQRKSYVTQLHKVYNDLNQAIQLYLTERNAINVREAGLNSNEKLDQFIKSTFKVVQDCGAQSTPCFAPNSEYKKISGVAAEGSALSGYVVLSSGVAMGYSYGIGDVTSAVTIDVDLNGAKGPNISGRDVFVLRIYNNGVIDDGDGYKITEAPLTKEQRDTVYNEQCASSNNKWAGCFGKILNDNWEMTY